MHPMFSRATPDDLLARLRVQAADSAPDQVLAQCDRCAVTVVGRSDSRYPQQLAIDPEAPEVLFVRGDLEAIDARRVGVIGTRHATAAGRATATELGEALADEGVSVVSGSSTRTPLLENMSASPKLAGSTSVITE